MHASSGTGYTRLISFSRLTHLPVKAIRGQTDMSNPGKTDLRGRSHADATRSAAVLLDPPPRRSVLVMRFTVSGCFPGEADGLS